MLMLDTLPKDCALIGTDLLQPLDVMVGFDEQRPCGTYRSCLGIRRDCPVLSRLQHEGCFTLFLLTPMAEELMPGLIPIDSDSDDDQTVPLQPLLEAIP
jgi:hypothetical protein